METTNKIARIRELITLLLAADKAYYGEDDPILTDREYDALTEELKKLESETGIVFANSPSRRVGGENRAEFQKVMHSKPMLSAKKTKSVEELLSFSEGKDVVLSRKMDGLTLVLRYENGCFRQAITRGEDGLVGEDVTHTVSHFRNIPKKVRFRQNFEVRGEGVVSWAEYRLMNRGNQPGHPRNAAAGLVRSITVDKGRLSHLDFYAFELILPDDPNPTKTEQLDFLSSNGFDVVEHFSVRAIDGEEKFRKTVDALSPESSFYPVDGVIAEYDDIAFGKGLGATAHHENRMIAFKWEDDEVETVFRGIEPTVTRTGLIALTAFFDPVLIDGTSVERADLHSFGHFEQFRFGVGDRIKVYKANRIIPQISENLTKSGTVRPPERCPCCGSLLEVRISTGGAKNLYCPNEDCIARNAQKLARFCDRDAMNLIGFNASVIEKMMAYGVVKTFRDLFRLEKHRDRILSIPGFGPGIADKLIASSEGARRCHLAQFLNAVGIPLMRAGSAAAIDEYFYGSWEKFEKAIREGFRFSHIAGISPTLERNLFSWYADEAEGALWRPVLQEITFIGQPDQIGKEGNPFFNANVVVTGCVNGMNRKDITDLMVLLGASVSDRITKGTTYLIVGEDPGTEELSEALRFGTKIVTEGHFAKMLSEQTVPDAEN